MRHVYSCAIVRFYHRLSVHSSIWNANTASNVYYRTHRSHSEHRHERMAPSTFCKSWRNVTVVRFNRGSMLSDRRTTEFGRVSAHFPLQAPTKTPYKNCVIAARSTSSHLVGSDRNNRASVCLVLPICLVSTINFDIGHANHHLNPLPGHFATWYGLSAAICMFWCSGSVGRKVPRIFRGPQSLGVPVAPFPWRIMLRNCSRWYPAVFSMVFKT